MILRFFLYSIFKNLRFADPFLILYFLDLRLTYSQIGLLLGFQHLVTVLLECPSGLLADAWGRRRATALCFVFYAAAFSGFGLTSLRSEMPVTLRLGGCLMLFALGEALRTGSHKAIMLDYLDSSGQLHLATQLIGRTRAVSKYSSAISAVCGGLLLAWSRQYSVLFFLSAGAAAGGFLLMLTYPRELEGDSYRERQPTSPKTDAQERQQLRKMWSRPQFVALFCQSILLESQLKIVLKYFTQPFLKAGLGLLGMPIVTPIGVSGIVRAGAFWVGLSEFVRDALGGLGARMSPRFEQRAGGRHSALNRAYLGGVLAVLGLAVCAVDLRWGLVPGLLILIFLTVLQNLRRPIFVSTLDTEMMKSQRASILSLESVCRAVTVAVLLPAFGLAANHFGLMAVWVMSSIILVGGLLFKPNGETLPMPVTADDVNRATGSKGNQTTLTEESMANDAR